MRCRRRHRCLVVSLHRRSRPLPPPKPRLSPPRAPPPASLSPSSSSRHHCYRHRPSLLVVAGHEVASQRFSPLPSFPVPFSLPSHNRLPLFPSPSHEPPCHLSLVVNPPCCGLLWSCTPPCRTFAVINTHHHRITIACLSLSLFDSLLPFRFFPLLHPLSLSLSRSPRFSLSLSLSLSLILPSLFWVYSCDAIEGEGKN